MLAPSAAAVSLEPLLDEPVRRRKAVAELLEDLAEFQFLGKKEVFHLSPSSPLADRGPWEILGRNRNGLEGEATRLEKAWLRHCEEVEQLGAALEGAASLREMDRFWLHLEEVGGSLWHC